MTARRIWVFVVPAMFHLGCTPAPAAALDTDMNPTGGLETATSGSATHTSTTGSTGTTNPGIRVRLSGNVFETWLLNGNFLVQLRSGCMDQPGSDVVEAGVHPYDPLDPVVVLSTAWADLPETIDGCTFEYWAAATEDTSGWADVCETYGGWSEHVAPTDAPAELVVALDYEGGPCDFTNPPSTSGSTGTSTSTGTTG